MVDDWLPVAEYRRLRVPADLCPWLALAVLLFSLGLGWGWPRWQSDRSLVGLGESSPASGSSSWQAATRRRLREAHLPRVQGLRRRTARFLLDHRGFKALHADIWEASLALEEERGRQPCQELLIGACLELDRAVLLGDRFGRGKRRGDRFLAQAQVALRNGSKRLDAARLALEPIDRNARSGRGRAKWRGNEETGKP